MSEPLLCDICEKPVTADDFVGLVALERGEPDERGGRQYVVAETELAVGKMLDCDVYAHASCVAHVGELRGELKIGHG